MALRVKKQIKNPDGTITEIEGTEAEVEAFLRKHDKMKEAPVAKPKRDLILGKDAEDRIRQLIGEELGKRLMTHEQLADFIRRTAPATGQTHHYHHWYHDNGWWWRPYWTGLAWTYQYTNSDPDKFSGMNGPATYSMFNSSDEMSSHLGFSKGYVESKITGTPYSGIATNGSLVVDANTTQNWASNNLKLSDLKLDHKWVSGIGSVHSEPALFSTTADAVPTNFVGYCTTAPLVQKMGSN